MLQNVYMTDKPKFKSRKGAALVISIFLAITGTIMVMTMFGMTQLNMNQITDNKSGSLAYYAAEAGLEDVRNYFNMNISDMGIALSGLNLPDESTPKILVNNSQYWVDSIIYQDSNTAAIVDIIGTSGNASRKIRVKLAEDLPSIMDDYGLLTDGSLTIHGDKILKMSIHGNDGLNLTGTDITENDAVASQSVDDTADPPHPVLNPVGGYEPEVEIPIVPINDLRLTSHEDGIVLDIDQEDLTEQIHSAPDGSKIYIDGTFGKGKKMGTDSIDLSGDLGGKLIFIDGDLTVNINGVDALSNGMIVLSGKSIINGCIDIGTSHEGYMDVIFASGGDITLNGTRTFDAMFWTNGYFTQNGSSMAGKVISQTGLTFNGEFTLDNSNDVYDPGVLDNIIAMDSWQFVPMD